MLPHLSLLGEEDCHLSSLAAAKSSIAILSKFPILHPFGFSPAMLSVSKPRVWCWGKGDGVALLTKGPLQH